MKLHFWHGQQHLHEVDIEPQKDAALPKLAFVGAVTFLLDEITIMEDGSAEAQYQAQSPLVLPPAQPVAAHFYRKPIIQ